MNKFYTKQDSEEIRNILKEARKNQTQKQRWVITAEEFESFKKLGRDMENYVSLPEFLKITRKKTKV